MLSKGHRNRSTTGVDLSTRFSIWSARLNLYRCGVECRLGGMPDNDRTTQKSDRWISVRASGKLDFVCDPDLSGRCYISR